MTVPDNPIQELVSYLADLLHGGHLNDLTQAQVTELERLLDLVSPGWDKL